MSHYQYVKNPGRYDVTVKGAGIARSKNKDTPYVFLECETDSGERITAERWLTESEVEAGKKTQRQRTINELRMAFGFNDDFHTLKEQVVGKRCSITVEMQEYNGKEYAKVAWVNALGGGFARAELNDDDFIAQLNATAARLPRPAGVPAPPEAVARRLADPFKDEEVPF